MLISKHVSDSNLSMSGQVTTWSDIMSDQHKSAIISSAIDLLEILHWQQVHCQAIFSPAEPKAQ